jgi:hypothetical protein
LIRNLEPESVTEVAARIAGYSHGPVLLATVAIQGSAGPRLLACSIRGDAHSDLVGIFDYQSVVLQREILEPEVAAARLVIALPWEYPAVASGDSPFQTANASRVPSGQYSMSYGPPADWPTYVAEWRMSNRSELVHAVSQYAPIQAPGLKPFLHLGDAILEYVFEAPPARSVQDIFPTTLVWLPDKRARLAEVAHVEVGVAILVELSKVPDSLLLQAGWLDQDGHLQSIPEISVSQSARFEIPCGAVWSELYISLLDSAGVALDERILARPPRSEPSVGQPSALQPPAPLAPREYDVALSFAGPDRPYVDPIATKLKERKVEVFYDLFERAELWGEDLVEALDDIYRKKARFTVMFASARYAQAAWPTHERRSAMARALTSLDSYILPVRLDDTEIPGLRPTVGYIDMRHTSQEDLVDLILQKLGRPGRESAERPQIPPVPRTPTEQQLLLLNKPPYWEYLLLGGVLIQGKQRLEPKWLDHQIRYTTKAGPALNYSEAMSLLTQGFDDLQSRTKNAARLLSEDVQRVAFGPPGVPGNVQAIEHIGTRLIEFYDYLLIWPADIRSARVPGNFEKAFELAASLADQPLLETRAFIEQVVSQYDGIPELIAGHNPEETVVVESVLVLTIDEQVLKEFNREMGKLARL